MAAEQKAAERKKVFTLSAVDGQAGEGRGSADGWVPCPLCVGERARRKAVAAATQSKVHVPGPRPCSRKLFARGRGLRAHLDVFHRPGQGHWASDVMEEMTPDDVMYDAEDARVDTRREGGEGDRQAHPGLAAAAEGDVEGVSGEVDKGWKWWVDGVDKHGSTALEWAGGAGQIEVVLFLMADLEARVEAGELEWDVVRVRDTGGTRGGRTVLHWAARNGQTEIVRVLAGRFGHVWGGEWIDAPAGDATTPLQLALYGGHTGTAEVLVFEYGADLGATNDWGCTSSHWASMCTAKSVYARSQHHAPSSDQERAVEEGGHAARVLIWLMDALRRKECDVLALLATKQKTGRTALHKAAHRGNTAACTVLLQASSTLLASRVEEDPILDVEWVQRVGCKDDAGFSPSDVAYEMGWSDLGAYLHDVERRLSTHCAQSTSQEPTTQEPTQEPTTQEPTTQEPTPS